MKLPLPSGKNMPFLYMAILCIIVGGLCIGVGFLLSKLKIAPYTTGGITYVGFYCFPIAICLLVVGVVVLVGSTFKSIIRKKKD